MVDFTSRLGRRINRRIRHEKVIWLTTVDLRHRPQPRQSDFLTLTDFGMEAILEAVVKRW